MKHARDYENTLGQPYDPDSIMHASHNAFGRKGRRTIRHKKERSRMFGSSTMSPIDITQLNLLYKYVEYIVTVVIFINPFIRCSILRKNNNNKKQFRYISILFIKFHLQYTDLTALDYAGLGL